jgi:single-strand DNA-binding protein
MSNFNINRVVIVGRLTRDPELRALPSGINVGSLRVACNSSRRDPDGNYTDRPNFFDVSIYGASAESVNRYMRKGSRVALDGRLEWREWETDNQKRQAVSIVADTIQFLEGPGDRPEAIEESGAQDGGGEEQDSELAGVGAGVEEELVF